MQMTPTVVVGVGDAGLDIVDRLHDSDGLGWGSAYNERFEYVTIDSDGAKVWSVPDGVTKVHLQPRGSVETDIQTYPYLTESLYISDKGAQRQRPVGRYKLDSSGSYEATVEAITETVETHVETIKGSSDLGPELNVVHVHSLGGGTGSGTFPLVASIIDDLVAAVESEHGIEVFTAGIGITTETFLNLDTYRPPGDERYYANTYAALRDLKKLIDADPDDPLPIHRYTEFEDVEDLMAFNIDGVEPQRELTGLPYQNYFFISVDEAQMAIDEGGPEPYRDAVDNGLVAAVYGIAAEWGSTRLHMRARLGRWDIHPGHSAHSIRPSSRFPSSACERTAT